MINTNWDSSQMVESVVIQVKCLNTIISEAENGETIANEMLSMVDMLDDPETKSGTPITMLPNMRSLKY